MIALYGKLFVTLPYLETSLFGSCMLCRVHTYDAYALPNLAHVLFAYFGHHVSSCLIWQLCDTMRVVDMFGTIPDAFLYLACLCLLHASSRLHVCLRVVRTLCPHFP